MLRSIKKAGFNEKIFDVGQQVKLNYVEGLNHGRTLVLIPAQIVNWENYYKVLPELSKKFRVYAVDIRGHGKSSWTTFIKRYQKSHPGELTLDIPYLVPFSLRLFIKNLSQFDPDFARAFVDGRFYEGIDHEEALKKMQCPMLLLRAIWSHHPEYGLVGAMDDDDAQRAREIVPNLIYRQSKANHVIHSDRPKEFIRELEEFAEEEVI